MPFLRFEDGPLKDTVKTIRSGRVSIGRTPDNDIVVDDDTVSSAHAAISFINEAYFVEDLDSANGTRVNGVRIQRKRLRDGDEILIGKTKLVYRDSGAGDHAEKLPLRRRKSSELLKHLDPGTPSPESMEVLGQAHENLRRVYEINGIISSIFDVDELTEKMLDIIFPLFDADCGYIMFADKDSGGLKLAASKRRDGSSPDNSPNASAVEFSHTIAELVLESEESIISVNAPEDDRFKQQESILDGSIKSAMCVPIRGRKEKIGVIYVDHRGRAGHFSDDHLQLLTMVGNSVGVAVENIRLYEDNLKMNVLRAVNEEMRETNRKLTELEAVKEDLINMVVHDMKNPVTNTMMGLDMVEYDSDGKLTKQQSDFLRLAKRNQYNLSEMINNLLEISKLESGALEIVRAKMDVLELIDRTVKRHAEFMRNDGKAISVSVDPDARWIEADIRLIERIISNILSNAIKHSHPNGEIIVQVAPISDGVEISVQDFGGGIPAEYHEQIFEKFCQAGLREFGHKTDTGLGLAFCKMAVEAHGGTIRVESEPDKGSRFTFSLPG
jgi:signal transduction histidine kinase